MLFPEHLVLIRGGGDLATGAAWRLHHAGFPIVVTELAAPLTIRRSVAVSTAVTAGEVFIEGLQVVLCAASGEAAARAGDGAIAVLVDPDLPDVGARVVVDARMAKANWGTTKADADIVVALGPGFVAGVDCHAVVETKRGHHLGRVIWDGSAAADSGTPGKVGGRGAERVIRAPTDGAVQWEQAIGDAVVRGDVLGSVGGRAVHAPLAGVIRGLIADGHGAREGLKIADIDPRGEASAATEISDKALAVGGGVVEAVMAWLNR